MRGLIFLAALGALAACGEQQSLATFTCPNGPDLIVTYTDDSARVVFPDGRVETLPRVEEGSDIYAKPGLVWDADQFRSARLTDGQSSFACDQMAG
jgi:hypothetical protein